MPRRGRVEGLSRGLVAHPFVLSRDDDDMLTT
jgi:hypothetical protein